MIVVENVTINGKEFTNTYSTNGVMVEREGVRYAEAIDPVGFGRQYTETDEPIEGYSAEATEVDYQAALRNMGVDV